MNWRQTHSYYETHSATQQVLKLTDWAFIDQASEACRYENAPDHHRDDGFPGVLAAYWTDWTHTRTETDRGQITTRYVYW